MSTNGLDLLTCCPLYLTLWPDLHGRWVLIGCVIKYYVETRRYPIYKCHVCCVSFTLLWTFQFCSRDQCQYFRIFFSDSGEILESWLAAVIQEISSWSKGSSCSGDTQVVFWNKSPYCQRWLVAILLKTVRGGIFVFFFWEYFRVKRKQWHSETGQGRHRNFALEFLVVFRFGSGPRYDNQSQKFRQIQHLHCI